jgi:hypothetical protein
MFCIRNLHYQYSDNKIIINILAGVSMESQIISCKILYNKFPQLSLAFLWSLTSYQIIPQETQSPTNNTHRWETVNHLFHIICYTAHQVVNSPATELIQ